LRVTDVVKTTAGKLPYKCIYHAVGPCWSDYTTSDISGVEQCMRDLEVTLSDCIRHAERDGFTSVALPSISSGNLTVILPFVYM